MKCCTKCNINVRGQNEICPLCQGRLEGVSEDTVFPEIDTVYKQHKLLLKILILSTVCVGVIAVAINLILSQTGVWSLFVVLGIICFWLSLVTAFKNRKNHSKNIIKQVVLISTLCIIWDYITDWRGWSLDYVFPIVCMVAMLSLQVLSKILNSEKEDYQVCLIIDVVLGTAPLIFYFSGITNVSIPSVICAAMSVVFLAFILLFYGSNIKKELSKRFHI